MKSGYKIRWTVNALLELESTIRFLEENWSEHEVQRFARALDHTIELIYKNPNLFQVSDEKRGIRRAVILRLNSLYYRKIDDTIEILSLFSNRQDPKRLDI